MILPIYVYGQPVLRKVAEDIAPDYPNLKELIENMFETMDHAEGVGLAAPQIGLAHPRGGNRFGCTCPKICQNIKISARRISMPIFWRCPVRRFLWTRAA